MRKSTGWVLMSSVAMLWACSHTVVVTVPPRLDLQGFGTVGIVEFTSNSDAAINNQTTREFQAHIHSAQPGTRILELGSREEMVPTLVYHLTQDFRPSSVRQQAK